MLYAENHRATQLCDLLKCWPWTSSTTSVMFNSSVKWGENNFIGLEVYGHSRAYYLENSQVPSELNSEHQRKKNSTSLFDFVARKDI